MSWNPMTEGLPAHALREITRVVAEPADLNAVNAALEREHYRGAVTCHNRDVVKLALRHNQVLAILVWTRAARKLAAREASLGWDGRTRTRRLALLVQNNRFWVLLNVRQTNLGSRVLGPAVALGCAESLAKALRAVPDPRRAAGRPFPLPAMLTGAVLAPETAKNPICFAIVTRGTTTMASSSSHDLAKKTLW